MNQRIRKLVSQLKEDEIDRVIKTQKIKVPENWSKSLKVDLLSHNITEKELDQALVKSKEMNPQLKGSVLEKHVMQKFSKLKYTVEANVKSKGFAEFDVVGWKDLGLFKTRKYIFVECKNKSRVIPEDWKKFIGNFSTFKKKYRIEDEDTENVTAYLYTTGLFHPDITKEVKKYSNIKLQRVRA